MQLASKKERQKCPSTQNTSGIARADGRRILSHRSTPLCLVQGTDHLASGRIMMSAGVDVRPVILGDTCHMGSANYGTPCTSLGDVCKYKLGSPATFSSLPKNLRELRGDKQSRLKSLPTSNFVERLQLLLQEGFTSHPWTRTCACRWRSCDGELTRWSNDPALGAEHATVQRDSRFPRAMDLWACRGRSRITSVNSLTNGNRSAGLRTVPVFGAACEFQVVPGPAQELQESARRGARTMNLQHGYIEM